MIGLTGEELKEAIGLASFKGKRYPNRYIQLEYKELMDIAQAQLKKVAEWGEGDCEHNPPNPFSQILRKGLPRKDCPECWQELLKEVEE